jgi:tetratricopeptide (TPR) repeat protein
MAQDLPARAVEDLRRAVELAREIGNPWFEHNTAFNMALMLYRRDDPHEAVTYARRARALGERLLERPIPATPLLLAEILLILEEYDEAASVVASMTRSAPPASNDLTSYYMLLLVLADVGSGCVEPPAVGWDEVLRMAEERGLSIDEILQMFYWRARVALAGGRIDEAVQALEEARRRRGARAIWLRRFEELEGTITEQRRAGSAHRPATG